MTHKDAEPLDEEHIRFEQFWRDRKGTGFVGYSRAANGEYHTEFLRDAFAAWHECQHEAYQDGYTVGYDAGYEAGELGW